MRKTICKFLQTLLLFWLIPGAVAQTALGNSGSDTGNKSDPGKASSDAGNLQYSVKAWNWATEEWKPDNLPPDRSPLLRSLPELFAKDWDSAPDHRLSDNEKLAIRKNLKSTAIALLDKEDSRLLLEKDRILLFSNSPETELAALAKSQETSRKKRQTIEPVELKDIGLPDILPLKRITSVNGQPVLERTGASAQSFGQGVGTDLLFTGLVGESGGYLHVEIELWSVVENRVLKSWKDVFAPDEAAERLVLARNIFHEFLLGRPWASLEIRVEPTNARILFDGKQSQMQPYRNPYLEPHQIEVKVTAPGYLEKVQTVELKPFEVRLLKLSLEKSEMPLITVDSDPPGAGIWVDSQYLGTAPLKIPSPLYTVRLKMSMKDYLPQYKDIQPDTPLDIHLSLVKEKPGITLQDAKDRFYFSLACFSLSLTTTIFLKTFSEQYGTLTSYYSAYYDGTSTTWNNLVKSSYTQQGLQGCYYGGIALTSGVFVWMMCELGNYLSTAEDPLR